MLYFRDAGLSESQLWAKYIAKYRVEHDRSREDYIAAGGLLGPVTYVEDGAMNEVTGEWRSEILKDAA